MTACKDSDIQSEVSMENFVTIAKTILLHNLPHDGVFVNYTMTGGNDTLYLAKFVSEGNVYAFTEDSEAMDRSMAVFESSFQDNVQVIQDKPLEIDKYLTCDINGFIVNTVKSNMIDGEIKRLVDMSLGIMKVGARGGILLRRDMTETVDYLMSLSREKVGVLRLAMANEDVPDVYIIERIQ